ncbi:MAG TPA: ABC transporter permease, partial [Verrucomicrobiae bacterium]
MGELRVALRGLSKNRGFAVVAILSLALGIAATTALFSVVYGVLIRPYPYKDCAKIWSPHLISAKNDDNWGVYPMREYQEFAKLPAFADVMATSPEGDMLLGGEYTPDMIRCVRVTPNAFQFLGVPTVVGRTILPTDVDESGEPADVMVLSFRMWQRLFDGSPTAIGKSLRLNDRLYQVIGVMPPRFGWWTDDGFWMPMAKNDPTNRRRCVPIVRLKENVTVEAAEAQAHALHQALLKEGSTMFGREEFRTRLVNYMDMTVASGDMERNLWLLFGAVVLLLMIACANVANLQLARSSTRAR